MGFKKRGKKEVGEHDTGDEPDQAAREAQKRVIAITLKPDTESEACGLGNQRGEQGCGLFVDGTSWGMAATV